MTKNYIYSIPLQLRQKIHKYNLVGETSKVIIKGEPMTSGVTSRIWRVKGGHQSLWNEAKIRDQN